MLRVLLSVAGVLFIGLGVFGGNLLNGLFGGSSQIEPTAKVEVPASTESVVQAASAQTADGGTLIGEDQAATAVSTSQLSQLASVEPATKVMESLESDNVSDDGAEPIAPAQAAGDLIAMAEQAKSSIRNEQVNIASTVLASSKTPVTATETKTEEVESVFVSATGEVNNGLVVVGDRVNMREGPSIEHPIVLTLDEGQELMEFKRVGKWVHVGAFGTSGKIGWVHERLVGSAQ